MYKFRHRMPELNMMRYYNNYYYNVFSLQIGIADHRVIKIQSINHLIKVMS